MTTINFKTDEPALYGLGTDHGILGKQADSLMGHEAYLNDRHPQHHQVLHEVRSRFHVIFGDGMAKGSSGTTMVFPTEGGT